MQTTVNQESTSCPRLIPGIPDDFTVRKILTKLSWRTLCTVSSLNSNWKETIMSGEVYRNKLAKQRSESFLVILGRGKRGGSSSRNIACMFDPREKVWTMLPQIRTVREGFPLGGQICVSGGKLLVTGGFSASFSSEEQFKTVFMLDIGACHTIWNRRADMLSPRTDFGCHSMQQGEKIMICGGVSGSSMETTLGSTELYHLGKNVWESSVDMLDPCFCPVIEEIGGNLHIVTGLRRRISAPSEFHCVSKAEHVELYKPGERKWIRAEPNFLRENTDNQIGLTGSDTHNFFIHQESLHRVSSNSVDYLVSNSNWNILHSHSWIHVDREPYDNFQINSVVSIDGKLLSFMRARPLDPKLHFMEADGFGNDQYQIEWGRVSSPCDFINTDYFPHKLYMSRIIL